MAKIEIHFKYSPDNYTIYLKDRNAWIQFIPDELNKIHISLDLAR